MPLQCSEPGETRVEGSLAVIFKTDQSWPANKNEVFVLVIEAIDEEGYVVDELTTNTTFLVTTTQYPLGCPFLFGKENMDQACLPPELV